MAGGTERTEALDLLKTVLVAGMISAHCVQLLAEAPPGWALGWAGYVNLVTFSGFLLAFGIGVGMSRRVPPWRARLVAVLRIWLAVVASSLGYQVLVERMPLTGGLVWDVASTRVLFGWSEFLTAFLVLYLLLAVLRPWVGWVAVRPAWLMALGVAGLGSTWVTVGAFWPMVGGLVGHREYASFPVLGYGPWFLAGLWIGARGRGIEAGEVALGAAATGVFLLAWWGQGWVPDRFPPSVPWVIGAGLPLALYVWGAGRVSAPGWALAAGRHVLASLVVSNLLIFGARAGWGWPLHGGWAILGAALALFAVVTLWGLALDRLGRKEVA
ncbi:hypothetical protein [Rubellimicrobium aerolatum]|uniref:DUF1624 domain-containing protein n=1 Tax=Rubellimicrobium aerolatum TaxID=490979 RepID=A0ABW0SI68_9RHOB|nr:hypothetical protein [Rubellimicrobium aerolatum]MBP1807559.1 hypothetical protein [Rubellimicrobium aerolatum]